MPVRKASYEVDHARLSEISKTSKYTTGFTNIMYSGPDNYARGWIGMFVERGVVKGFICLRHAVRKKQTTVYDVCVDPKYRGKGIGKKLIDWAMKESPFGVIRLNVDTSNRDAMEFYKSIGFVREAKGFWKSGVPYVTYVKEAS